MSPLIVKLTYLNIGNAPTKESVNTLCLQSKSQTCQTSLTKKEAIFVLFKKK